MIDVRLIVFLCGAIFALVLGGFGMYRIGFWQGFVNGRESMSEECGFKPEDRE
jgi:hypothetical protein